jgi:catechol 2,3-dioxygenase-like lactoylglutathione lyase family enzyme
MRLGRAILFVKDFDRLLAFYCNTLGLRVLTRQETPGWVELDAGGTALALHAVPSEIARDIAISSPPRTREESPTKLVFVVPNVESERARPVSLGVPMSDVRSWGACDGVDPEGNVFQISAT